MHYNVDRNNLQIEIRLLLFYLWLKYNWRGFFSAGSLVFTLYKVDNNLLIIVFLLFFKVLNKTLWTQYSMFSMIGGLDYKVENSCYFYLKKKRSRRLTIYNFIDH